MNDKLLMICDEISKIFHNNKLTYGDCLVIIYVLKEVIEKDVETGIIDTIESTIKKVVGEL